MAWCFALGLDAPLTAALTSIPLRSVFAWTATFRELVRVKEKAHQEAIKFSSEGCASGFCHLQEDATRIKKSHYRDEHHYIRSTDHSSAVVLLQQNSLKAVVRPMAKVSVAVGSDGKPGAPPPEKGAFIYDVVLSVLYAVDVTSC